MDQPKIIDVEQEMRDATGIAEANPEKLAKIQSSLIKSGSPLNIYVLWQPVLSKNVDVSLGQNIANQIYATFCRNDREPLTRGIGIPVYFRSVPFNSDSSSPLAIDLDNAQHSAIIVLIDDEMLNESKRWNSYLTDIGELCKDSGHRHLMIPVAVSANATQFLPGMAMKNVIRYYDIVPTPSEDSVTNADISHLTISDIEEVIGKETEFSTWLLYTISRFLQANPQYSQLDEESKKARIFLLKNDQVRLFISHAKQDGIRYAEELKSQIEKLPTKAFFDRVSIEPANQFDVDIKEGIRDSIFVALHTDAYGTREWCRREVLLAKQMQRPFIAVNAIESGEFRGFPYLGNVPVLRWNGRNAIHIVKSALLENLRFEYARRHINRLQRMDVIPPNAFPLLRPPELIDFIALKSVERDVPILYPDPPLGNEELDILREFWTGNNLITPVTGKTKPNLKLGAIGISISQSEDSAELGLGRRHEKDLLVELGRHLLACGAQLVYGGHLGTEGWTRVLFDLVSSYNRIDSEVKKIVNFVAWDWSLDATKSVKAQFFSVGDIQKVALPPEIIEQYGLDIDQPLSVSEIPESDKAYICARALTAMREEMNDFVNARIVMGGKVQKFQGKFPGVLEEVEGCLRRNKPIYILGGFGGCCSALVKLIQAQDNEIPLEFTSEFQMEDHSYRDMVQVYNKNTGDISPECAPIDYSIWIKDLRLKLIEMLVKEGAGGFTSNGLTSDENQRLFMSVDIEQIVFLVLKGLKNVSSNMS